MKPKTMILMFVAVTCGLVASYMTSRLLAERNNTPAENLVPVVFTTKKVHPFILLKKPEDMFEVRQVPEGPLTAKAVTSLDDLKGKKLKRSLDPDSPVSRDDLLKKEESIIEIPAGQRATAIQVNPKTLAGGFILPGMRVDIIATMRNNDQPTSLIIMQNMLVLAIDTKATRDDTNTVLGSTVTLAATPEECQRLTLAAQQGELCLALRSQEDKRLVTVKPARTSEFGKPVGDRNQETGEATTDNDPPPPSGVQIGKQPELPPVVPTPPPQPEVKPEPEVKPTKTHTLTVDLGDSHKKYLFTQDNETGEWLGGNLNRNSDDDQPVRRAPKEPKPAPTQDDAKESKRTPK